VKITKGKYLDHAHFDGMSWPLPTLELFSHLHDSEDPVRFAAASIVRAYHQMVFDPLKKRQRVVNALRAIRAPRPGRAP